MLDYDINYYPINTYPYTSESYIPAGVAVSDIWGLYNPYDPNNDFRRGKPLNNSIYVWYIGDSAYGTNACVSLARSSTLDMEVKTDGVPGPTPAAICAYNYGFDGQSLNSDRGFRVDPSIRLAYDITKDDGVGGWGKSCLLCDINPLKWCVYPEMAVYRFDTHVIGTFRTLGNLVSYLNADTTRRVISIRNYLYRGGETRTSSPTIWDDDGSTIEETPVMGLLKERPICDNLQSTVGAYIKNGQDYDSTKVYNPFNQANTTFFFRSAGRVEGNARQHDIGFAIQIQANSVIGGHDTVPDSFGRCSAFFAHYSGKNQVFDDVAYHWRYCLYDETIDRELPNGYNLSNITTHALRIMSVLEIDDQGDYTTYGDAVKAAVLHEVAFMGFWFADTQAKAASDPLGSASTGVGIYLPEKIGGITTGNYFTGEEIAAVPYADADSTAPFRYLPEESGEDVGDFSTIIHSGVLSAAATYYALKDQGLKDLIRYLNTTYNPDADQLTADFKGVNPFDYITSVKYYPFSLPYAVAQQINVGPLATGATGYILPYTYGNESYSYFDMGSYTFAPYFNNFLDYSATQILLYLPWCGSMQLDPALWIPQTGGSSITLNIRYSFDWVTGSCTAFIFRNGYMMETADGQVGIDIPLSLLATGSYQAAISQAMIAYKQAATSRFTAWLGLVGSAIGTAVAAASGVGAPAVVGGLAGIASSVNALQKTEYAADAADYTLNHTQPQLGSVSAASPFNGALLDQRPKLLISRPKYLTDLPQGWQDNYARSYGYACSIPTPLNSSRIRGLTKVSNPRLEGIKKTIGTQTFTPTERELEMIRQALAEGIIL